MRIQDCRFKPVFQRKDPLCLRSEKSIVDSSSRDSDMNLTDLGLNDWFQQKRDEMGRPDCGVARVTAVDRDRYLVMNEAGELPAEAAGNLLFSAESAEDLPCVGDWVLTQTHNSGTLAIVHGVIPRKTFLRRKTAGKTVDTQMIVANIDTALILQSCDCNFNLRRLERYMVMANDGGIEPVLLLSKTDLISEETLEQRIIVIRQAELHIHVIPYSNTTGFGMGAVESVFQKGKTYCLLGSSGVGKTTLLNRLIGRDAFGYAQARAFETSAVRKKDGKGRHTTARRQLTVLGNGALIIDTPGMRELGVMDAGDGIERSFSDIHELSGRCRFSDCTHTNEPDCAVLAAIRSGTLSEARLGSYLKLARESEYHRMSYIEKRRKDREFGRMVKSVMKHKKKA
jgi:ribosome biogenesis GTPase